MEPEKLRKDFPIFREHPELVYLDNAATSQKPEQVIDRVKRFYEESNSNPGRSLHSLARDATRQYREARSNVADFINARPEEIVFTRNTTEAINLVAESLELEGEILVPESSHHSEQLPLRRKAEESGLEFEFIPVEDGRIDLDAAREMIDDDTALVSVSQISNVFGTEAPVEKLAEIAHEHDAYIMVDAAQSAPRMPVDVEKLDVDFLVFSGHKMLGPTGIGVLYGRKSLLRGMEPYQVGGGMIRSVKRDGVEWEELPEKFEAGTPNVAGALGLAEAIKYLQDIGMEEVYRHDRKLSRMLADRLRSIEGVEVLSPENTSLVSFTMEEAHPHDISEIMDRENVAIRAGHHCAQPLMESLEVTATARVSPYIYNTEDDVERFVEAVREVKEVFSTDVQGRNP